MTLYQFMHDPTLCGAAFADPSWDTWRIIARLYDGDAALLTPEQQAIACRLIGRDELPTEAPRELFVAAGRRSGKTRFEALLAVHAAAQDYRDRLAPGEWATISVHAVDRRQAGVAFGYCVGLIQASPVLASEVKNTTAESIEFAHRTRIEVMTSSFRSVRGYTIALAVIDEAAFLRSETSALPDVELYHALVPALMTLGGRLVVTSSLHRKTGLMYSKWRETRGQIERGAALPAAAAEITADAPRPETPESTDPVEIDYSRPTGSMTLQQALDWIDGHEGDLRRGPEGWR